MYSFEPTEEQKLIINATKKLAQNEFRSRMRDADESNEPAPEWTRIGWELGLLPASIPEAYGGFGERSAITSILAAEELAWGDLSAALTLMAPHLVAIPVLLSGTSEQKEQLLPSFCGDNYVSGSAALMEPHFGFDPNNLKTTATKSNGQYVLSGSKCMVPFAEQSQWIVVYASLEGKSQGFLISRDALGLTIKEREKNLGLNAFPLYSIELRECSIPASQRLGGDAGCDFSALLSSSRIALSAMAVGMARAACEYTIEYTKNRRAFGEAIAQKQSIAFTLADIATEIEAARLLVWEAAWALDQGKNAVREACLARNYTGDMALMTADRAVQFLGGYGYTRDFPAELWLRNARAFTVLEGIAMI
jgi:alkylation response protein AidB-like acyl-CoA dehydrogenase